MNLFPQCNTAHQFASVAANERTLVLKMTAFEHVSTLKSRRKKNPIQDYQRAARSGQTKTSRFAQSASEDTTASPCAPEEQVPAALGARQCPTRSVEQ